MADRPAAAHADDCGYRGANGWLCTNPVACAHKQRENTARAEAT